MFSRSHFVICATALAMAGAGWAQPPGQMQPPGQALPPNQSQSTGTPMGVPQNTNANIAGMSPATPADPYFADKDFIRNAAESSDTEVHLGRIAQDKASSDAVKQLGKQLADAHAQNTEELKKAAAALKIDMPADPPKRAKKDEEKLARLSGAQFDQAYAKMAADEQKNAVKEFAREAKIGKSPALKDYANKKLPVEQERQKQAEELAGSGAGKAAPEK